ncbi:MAG: phosphate-starvation-inducible PsiE family protein [Saprospiraceae bacterium]|nr:phosphate-starvation-inducible PsiE family protein [Saprospiraceae bacterium]
MSRGKNDFFDGFSRIFVKFEQVLTVVMVAIIAIIIIIGVVRVLENIYTLFALDFFDPKEITFNDYQLVFGKILTLLISLEFMSSIIKVLHTHRIRLLINDVILITALAIARKLIIYDYDHADPLSVIVLGGLMISLGVFYYLINIKRTIDTKE